MKTMCLMARDCVVRQNANGRLCDAESTPAIVDPTVCVESVLAAECLMHDTHIVDAAMRNVAYLLHDASTTPDGARYHILGDEEVLADSMAKGPHVLMLAGYRDEAWHTIAPSSGSSGILRRASIPTTRVRK